MIPLLLFLLAVAAVYVGTIETAFSALMRLSLRLMAERGGRDDRLGYYLDDPIQLFVPARLLLGLIFSLATVLLAVLTGRSGMSLTSVATLLACVAVYILVCEHSAVAHRAASNPEACWRRCCRPSASIARVAVAALRRPRPAADERPAERLTAAQVMPDEEEQGEVAHAYLEAGEEQGLIEGDERRLLQSIVDFGDTLVREVMTPRPDIVAIQADATMSASCARSFASRSTRGSPSTRRTSTTSSASSSSRTCCSSTDATPTMPPDHAARSGRRRSCPRPSACRSC